MKAIAVIGTFDTKGKEFLFVKGLIEAQGMKALCVHTGVFEAYFKPDIGNGEVARAAGANIEELIKNKDRARAMESMCIGAGEIVTELYRDGRIDAAFSLGGSGGTSIGCSAMRRLPIGVPKVMVSTMASGNVAAYIGTSDIIMFPSVVDAEGLNAISMKILCNAVNAIVGMVRLRKDFPESARPLIAATMFGVTTPCVKTAKEYMEERGYEVLVFHATGTGGKCMEALIDGGYIKGVLDLTTTEWCDELFGGVLAAGSDRLDAAAKKGIPQVVSVGALDMINFGPMQTVPAEFANRNLYAHNPTVTLARTTVDENKKLGKVIAEKLNMAKGNTVVMLPLKGVSAIDVEGQPFFGPDEDQALFDSLKRNLNTEIPVIQMDAAINDEAFAVAAAQELLDMLKA